MKWYNNLKMRTKLLLGFLLVVIITITIGFIGILNINTISDNSLLLYEKTTVPLEYLGDVRENFQKMRVNVLYGLRSTNADDINKYFSKVLEINNIMDIDLGKIKSTLPDGAKKIALETIQKIKTNYIYVADQLKNSLVRKDNTELNALLQGVVKQVNADMQGAFDNLASLQVMSAAETSKNDMKTANSSVLIMFIFLIVSVFAAIGIGLFISKIIVNSLKRGLKLAELVASGNLNEKLDIDQKDEIGQLADTLNRMVEKLKEVVENVRSASDNVTSSAQELSSNSEQMSQGATEQAAAAEEASSSMEQMTSNIKQNADNAKQTEKIALKSSADAKEGGQAVKETAEAMKEIAGKISIIEEIARQTNLLALNAAIEAARAGEHGKGFAVVASEVRKLAERSQTAAAEINKLSASSIRVAEKAGELLMKIVPDIQRTSELVQEITASSSEQNSGAEQINGAIQQLNQVIQQNASAAEEMSSTAEELTSQAQQLQDTISFFKIEYKGTGQAVKRAIIEPHKTFESERFVPAKTFAQKPDNIKPKTALKNTGFNIDLGNKEDKLDREFEKY